MENNWCPMCNGRILKCYTPPNNEYVKCKKCSFMCDVKDFPRITASMGFAHAFVKYKQAEINNDKTNGGLDYLEVLSRNLDDFEKEVMITLGGA